MAVHNVIQNPTFSVSPRAAISNQPFTAGQKFAANQTRQNEIQQLLDSVGGNNELRSVLAQRFAEMEQQNVRTRNIDKIGALSGAPGALRSAGIPVTGLATASVPIQNLQQRADAQKTSSEATEIGAKAGQLPLQSARDQDITGFDVQQVTPTGVATARASGGTGAKLTAFVNGAKIELDLAAGGEFADIISAALARARGQPISTSGIGAGPQMARADAFIEKAGRNNPGMAYFPTMREDGVIIIHEHNQTTGETSEVQYFNAQGDQVSG